MRTVRDTLETFDFPLAIYFVPLWYWSFIFVFVKVFNLEHATWNCTCYKIKTVGARRWEIKGMSAAGLRVAVKQETHGEEHMCALTRGLTTGQWWENVAVRFGPIPDCAREDSDSIYARKVLEMLSHRSQAWLQGVHGRCCSTGRNWTLWVAWEATTVIDSITPTICIWPHLCIIMCNKMSSC